MRAHLTNWTKLILLQLLILTVTSLPGQSCSTFFINQNGQKIFGKNYDWHLGSGMIIINQRGMIKKGIHGRGQDPVEYASWTSKYGSLTFNQYGREMPTGGMNEAGLVVHLMALRETQYPQPDTRNPIKNLQWIQYQLDNFASVEQVIKANTKIRILNTDVPGLHFLVADRTGDCATIEWLEGKFVCHTKNTLPYKILTNNTYSDSLRYLQQHQGFGGELEIGNASSSLARFARMAAMLETRRALPIKVSIEDAFDILKNVAQSSTQWRIVYDLENRQVHYKTKSNNRRSSIDLSSFDLACSGPVKVLDIDKRPQGPITTREFYDYTRALNKKYITHALANTPITIGAPAHFVESRIRYPETTTCGQ